MYGEQSNSGFRVTENVGRRKLSEMRREQYRGDEVMKGTEGGGRELKFIS